MIAIDFETNGLKWWETTFQVTHLGVCDDDNNVSVYEHQEITEALLAIIEKHDTILVYNAGFELPIIKNLVPEKYEEYKNKLIDVMRLRQYYGIDNEHASFGLKDASLKILKAEPYETPLKQWCKERKYKENEFRKYLTEMPNEMVVQYVADDAIATIRLYKYFVNVYEKWGYDWAIDHSQYINLVHLVSEATRRGILVNRDSVLKYQQELAQKINENNELFRSINKEGIEYVENILYLQEVAKRKTDKGKQKVPKQVFNCNSDAQLAMLMVDYYKSTVRYYTPTGRPSFSADKINQFEQAYPLAQNGKLAIVENACKRLYELTEYDNQYHPQLKLVGTITGRLSGDGGLNVQGLSRKDKGFMSCLIARKGYTFVSSDGGAMEPTITANYSADANYRYAVYDGVGKPPYWKNDTLFIDDIYLMFLSKIPFGKTVLEQAFNKLYNGKTFIEQWLEDSEVIKNALKKERKLAKITVLGLGYGMGHKKLCTNLNDNGFLFKEDGTPDVSLAKKLHSTYWDTFSGLKTLSNKLSDIAMENNNFIVNPFGYGAVIDSPHKAFNFFIQSSVNPIINKYLFEWLKRLPSMHFVTLIHDELIMEIKEEEVELARIASAEAIKEVNSWLKDEYNWTLELRAGFVVGSNLYEAK